MSVLTDLFSQLSIESLIILIVSIGLAFKFLSELWDWIYNRLKKHFSFRTQKDQEHEAILSSIHDTRDAFESFEKNVSDKIEDLDCRFREHTSDMDEKFIELTKRMSIATDRLQETTRSYIIDKHHLFCYDVGAIDDLSLQSLERHFLYYKAAGGNSFIDGLMEEVRDLPRLNYQNKETLQGVAASR